jgi:threonine dehydratase
MPYSYSLCKQNVDRLTLVDDLQLRSAMGLLFEKMKLAIEPACAASTAAMFGPLKGSLRGRTVVLVFCGSNIDWRTFAAQALFENDSAA